VDSPTENPRNSRRDAGAPRPGQIGKISFFRHFFFSPGLGIFTYKLKHTTMHKAVILLTKANDSKIEALENVRKFLRGYENDVWDWYAIGGRWNNHLAPLQAAWRALGMAGQHPYCDHYHLPEDGNVYDVMPLKDCLSFVSSWVQDPKKVEEKLNHDKEYWKDDPSMLEYLDGLYLSYKDGEFSFESNVYNIDTGEAESLPKNITNYWAVMVDMHN